MPTAPGHRSRTSIAAIFGRLWEDLTPELARHVPRLGFSERDKARMHELAARNLEEALGPEELEELDNYIRVGDLLAIVQSRARKLLGTALARRDR